MYNNFQPLIASLIAVALGMDHFSLTKLFSAVLIFCGVYLVTRSKARPENEKGVLDTWEAGQPETVEPKK
jgi:drug/metabolite transporter (DMT)-like permease